MDKTYLPLESLKNWDKNFRNIHQEDFNRLKIKLESMEQIRPLIVTPDETEPGKYIVLGGNMRLKGYKDLYETNPQKYAQVWVLIVDFLQKEDGLWYANVSGVEAAKRFSSKLDAYMEYSLLDNDRSGYYDADQMANNMPQFNIDWSEYAIDLTEPITIQDFVDGVAPEDKQEEDPQPPEIESLCKCPACGELFNPQQYLQTTGELTTDV